MFHVPTSKSFSTSTHRLGLGRGIVVDDEEDEEGAINAASLLAMANLLVLAK
jgi:hypothetical protein